jgi:hypothetical protein
VIQFQYQKNRCRDRNRSDQESNDRCRVGAREKAKSPKQHRNPKDKTVSNGQGIELSICSNVSAHVWRMAPLISSALF